MKKTLKFFKSFFIIIFFIIVILIVSLNVLKFAIYSEFYDMKQNISPNPGLNDGFIPQGIAATDDGYILTSGYMKDKSASRIYVTKDNNYRYLEVAQNGKIFIGHMGGIATTKERVFIADEDYIYVVSLNDILNEHSASISLEERYRVYNKAAFVFTDETNLYVGEFHNGKNYITNHKYETKDGMYHAVVSCYAIDDLSIPTKIFSIRDKVQGFCITEENNVVLSTSYGLASSEYYVYDLEGLESSSITEEHIPVYYLDQAKKKFTGPAMGEDLDYYNGMVITLSESASNQYIFGKFFFAYNIYGLKLK